MDAQTCEQFRAALRAQGGEAFNKVARSARAPHRPARLRYWEERFLTRTALALGAPVPTFDEFLAIFASVELMYQPPVTIPGVAALVGQLSEFERSLDRHQADYWAVRFFTACTWIERSAEVAEYLVARLSRPALQALVQESLARLHPEYVEDPVLYSSSTTPAEAIAQRRETERAWAELFFRVTR